MSKSKPTVAVETRDGLILTQFVNETIEKHLSYLTRNGSQHQLVHIGNVVLPLQNLRAIYAENVLIEDRGFGD